MIGVNSGDRYRKLIRIVFLVLISIFYFAVPNARPDFSRFNCHDSESYLALTHSLVHGRGYTRSMIDGMYIGHTTWAPGVPVLMMPALAISGSKINWFAVKGTMVIVGLLGVILAWYWVRRVSGKTALADLSALLVAINPFYWDFSHQTMTEVPVIVWIFGALLLCDTVFAQRKTRYHESFLIGLVCGLGMLIKGTVGGLLFVPVAYFWGSRQMKLAWKRKIAILIVFGIGFISPFSAWMLRNERVNAVGYDSGNQVRMVFQKGMENREIKSFSETIHQVSSNLRTYIIYRLPEQMIPGLWFDAALVWKGSGWLVLGIDLLMFLVWIPRGWKDKIVSLDFVLLPMMIIYLLASGSARYWVSVSILFSVLLILRLNAWIPLEKVTKHIQWLLIIIALLTINLGTYVVQHEKQPYNPHAPWRELAELFNTIAKEEISPAGVLTPNMHAFQLITGYPAPMATQQYNPSYDYMVARLDGEGPQPPQGAIPTITVEPWVLYRLPEPKTRIELLGDQDFSRGITISE